MNASEVSVKALEERNSRREQRQRTLAGVMHIIAKVLLSYFDMLTDVVLAITLLGTDQATYGVVSFGILGLTLFAQVFSVRAMGKASWISKDVFLTAIGFGPALEAYRYVFGEPQMRPGAQPAIALLGALKGVEVMFEAFPMLVLQLTLLLNEPNGWNSPVLVTSLLSSVVAAAVMIVDAESGANSVAKHRRVYHEYFCYLPLSGTRRYVLLLTMTFFTGGYLVLATSTLAVAVKLLPLAEVLVVLACDCAFYHALRVAADEWWILSDGGLTGSTFYRVLRMVSDEWWVFSDGGLTGMIAWVFGFLFNTTLWIMWHVCPVGTLRDSNWTGPHVMVWTVACSLIEYTVVICSVLFFPLAHPATVQVRTTVRLICLPALCVALVSLTSFFVAMEKQYRRTFYARDTRRAMHRRHWREAEGRPTADEDRARIVMNMRYLGDLASEWVVDGAAKWEHSQEAAAWYTEKWRQAVRGKLYAHAKSSRATSSRATSSRFSSRAKSKSATEALAAMQGHAHGDSRRTCLFEPSFEQKTALAPLHV
jgi:hypothetical protein